MYYFVLLLLVIFSSREVCGKRTNKTAFQICYILMTAMAILRYGQLTDYFNYEINYENPIGIMRDPLFAYLIIFCKGIGMPYELFSIIIDAITMWLAYPFFSKVCHKSALALLIYYCYIFLVLPMSGIRQGLCVSFMLLGFTYLLRGKKTAFYLLVAFGSFIHFSMLSVLFIGLFYDKKFYNDSYWWFVIIGLTGFALVTPDLSSYIPEFLAKKSVGEYQDSRLPQMILRFLIILPVLFTRPRYGKLGYYAKAICIIGYCMYCSLSFSQMIAGRLEFYFRLFIALFAASIIRSETRVRKWFSVTVLSMLVLIHVVLFYKNMGAFIEQGNYKESVTLFNFPYVSLFNKEAINDYLL